MILHLIHAVVVVLVVLSFPLGMAGAVVLFDDGGTFHRAQDD